MTEAQIQLQNALTTTFLANLAFLSEYDNSLYHRVDELSRMLENGSYKEKYALDFIFENGEFDIYDIVNDKYLYNKNPEKVNNKLIQKIQFDEKNSIVNISEYFLFKEKFYSQNKDKFKFEKREDFITLTQNNIFEYVEIMKDFSKIKKRIKRIKKFIFLGTLLGRHIPKIADKINAEIYLVLERNLEIFRLSLFVVDYTLIADKGVIFSIMDDEVEEGIKIFNFINLVSVENSLIKLSSTGINIDRYIDEILSTLQSTNPILYDYNRKIYSWLNRTTNAFKKKYKFLLFNEIENNFVFFKNIPVLYIAAGPSLDENIEWIKENQNNFFIVTIGAAYKKLIANKIKIDMLTTVDEKLELNELQFDEESLSELSNETIVLASAITHEKVLERLNKKNLFLYELFIPLHKNNVAFEGFSIGEVTLDILLKMNVLEMYLIGLDLSLNQITGESHAKGSSSGVVCKLNLDEKQDRSFFDDKESLIKVKGNFNKEVFTTSFFYSSIKDIEKKLDLKNKESNIYNLSIYGAHFEGTIPTKTKDIEESKLKRIKINSHELIMKLNQNSLSEISKDSRKELNKIIFYIKNDLNETTNKILNTEFESYEEFYKEIVKITDSLFENRFDSLFEIIINYTNMIIPYITYYFNDTKIKNESKKVNRIKETYINQIRVILDDYIFCLERIINEKED